MLDVVMLNIVDTASQTDHDHFFHIRVQIAVNFMIHFRFAVAR